MHFAIAIRSQPQATKAVQPRRRAFHHPSIDAQPAAMLRTSAGEPGYDTPVSDFLPVWIRVVGTVAVQLLRPLPRVAHLAAYRRDSVYQVLQLVDIGYVGAGGGDRQGQPLGIGENVVLGTQLAAIRRVFSAFLTSSQGPGMRAIHGGPLPVNGVSLLKVRQEDLVQAPPDAGPLPGFEV